jgi:large subunit ribosomal protein L34e
MHYGRKRGAKHTCAVCSAILQATAVKSKKLARLTKTQRRPERKFGGLLCSNCVESLVKEKTRLEMGSISREDVPLKHLKYIDKMTSH